MMDERGLDVYSATFLLNHLFVQPVKLGPHSKDSSIECPCESIEELAENRPSSHKQKRESSQTI